jgi:hypothetical protein
LCGDIVKTKVCGACKVEKPTDDFYYRSDTGGTKSICKPCNTAHCRKYQNKYYKERPEFRQASIDRMAEWRKRPENKQRHLGHVRKSTQKARDNLATHYVRTVLVLHTNLKRSIVPDSLVKAKRESLKIFRQLRSMK